MQMILITILVVVALRLLLSHKSRERPGLGVIVREEVAACLLTFVALFGAFLLVLCLTLFFGPIPPFHEW